MWSGDVLLLCFYSLLHRHHFLFVYFLLFVLHTCHSPFDGALYLPPISESCLTLPEFNGTYPIFEAHAYEIQWIAGLIWDSGLMGWGLGFGGPGRSLSTINLTTNSNFTWIRREWLYHLQSALVPYPHHDLPFLALDPLRSASNFIVKPCKTTILSHSRSPSSPLVLPWPKQKQNDPTSHD